MEKFGFVVFILAVLISLAAFIEKIRLPNPVFFVVAGLVIGFIPALPELTLDPDVVFILFLPPLLYDASYRTSWRDFRSDIRPIVALAFSLVLFTTIAIAVTAHYFIPGFTWPLAFLLGAIISPPDAVAASGIIKGLGLNKRIVTILEGESLLNDASALIIYRYALIAVTTGGFIFWKAGLAFLLVTGGGILIGVIIGYLLVFTHKKVKNNPVVETSLTLLTPFLSYLAAEKLHASGILAVVSTGLVISWRSPEILTYQTRIQSKVVWDTLMFLLSGFVFILIGMQLPAILNQLSDYPMSELLTYAILVSFVTILVRVIWVFGGAYSAKLFKGNRKNLTAESVKKYDETTWKNVLIISWSGTRGIISLAAALALPLTLSDGTAFPQRALILFICFVVIFITLVVQGLSLQLLVRLLKIKPANTQGLETKELQLQIVESTLDFIEEEFSSSRESHLKEELIKNYELQAKRLTKEIRLYERHEKNEEELPIIPLTSIQEARIKISKFQRELLLTYHKEGSFDSSAIQEIQESMDIDELQFVQRLPEQENK